MPDAKHSTSSTPYATRGDFHRIFREEEDALYRLSFLLTADPEKAQRCFVSGLEDSVKGNPVFKEWARSWARRTIIQNAVRLLNPRPIEESAPVSVHSSGETPAAEHAEIAAILELEPFERFVFVMSVMEHYSEHECAILLSCSQREVIAARSRALQQIGSATRMEMNTTIGTNSNLPRSHIALSAAVLLLLTAFLPGVQQAA
jgi:DNA-directed RNA polymerase specialized sigma24 family protein